MVWVRFEQISSHLRLSKLHSANRFFGVQSDQQMGADPDPKPIPKLVKVNKSLKLAEAWVNNMSGSASGELNEIEFEGRPPRLGLGAKVVRNSKPAASNDPVERRLLGKLNAASKRRSLQNSENEAEDGNESGEEDDDERESRTNISAKKRPMPLVALLCSKKKK